jgi:cysteinyl-tRNA synthetase
LQELAQPPSSDYEPLLRFLVEIDSKMDDDLNISAALGTMFDFIRFANKKMVESSLQPSDAQDILEEWEKLNAVFGFGMPVKSEVPAEVQLLVEERQTARKAKNFKRSDEIRDQLAKLGWIVEDTPQGPRAKRVG